MGLPFSVYGTGRGKLGAKAHGILALRGLGRLRRSWGTKAFNSVITASLRASFFQLSILAIAFSPLYQKCLRKATPWAGSLKDFPMEGLPASPLVSASGGKSLILFRRGMYAAEHSSYKAKFRRPATGGPPEPERSRTPSVRMPNGCPDGAPLTQNADFGRDLTG